MLGLFFKTDPSKAEVNKVISALGKISLSSLKIGVVNTKSPNALKRITKIFFGLNNSTFANKLSFHRVCIIFEHIQLIFNKPQT